MVDYAKLGWQADVPVNEMFSDPYFSLQSGEAETEYVFLKHNNFPDAFLTQPKPQSFSIGETGFGTGLNFFVTALSWKSVFSDTSESHLYFYSIEKYPIEKTQLASIFKNWPQFDEFTRIFIDQYPGNVPGYHQITFPKYNITLVLMIGDVCNMLDQLIEPMDAWYLDGFSPSKNPDMWTENVFKKIAMCSKTGATFSTFAAAGFVRRNLQSAGFSVKKDTGFGKKREMLYGTVERQIGRAHV